MKPKKSNSKISENTTGIKLQAFGKTIEEAFSNSLIGMFSAMYEKKVKTKYSHKIKIKGKNLEELLYNFLKEFILLFNDKRIFVSKIEDMKIDLNKNELYCVVSGDLAKNYKIHTVIKSVTYNNMFVKEEKGKWMIQVLLGV